MRSMKAARSRRATALAISGVNVVTIDDTIEVAPDGDGSAVTYTAIVKMKGLLGLFDPIMQLGFNRAGKQAAEGLRETLTRR